MKPAEETLDLVHEWLLTNGVHELNYSPAKDWISVQIDVSSAEALLDAEYSVYQHEDGSVLVRTEKWSLPRHLHEHVDTIQVWSFLFSITILLENVFVMKHILPLLIRLF